MNELSLDLSDPDIAKALEGCETGEHVEFSVGGELTKTGTKATVAVDSVKYSGGSGEEGSPEEEAKESPDEEAKEGDAPAGAAPGKKVPHAITIVMGGSSK